MAIVQLDRVCTTPTRDLWEDFPIPDWVNSGIFEISVADVVLAADEISRMCFRPKGKNGSTAGGGEQGGVRVRSLSSLV